MLQSKFKIGDVVYLNSNPETEMTIKRNMPNSQVIVNYFIRGNLKVFNFPSAMLTLVKK